MNNADQIPFRVFARVPAPGIKDNELYIPQYYTQGQWSSWAHPSKGNVAFATERDAQMYLIDFVKNKVEKTKQRINLLNTEVVVLEKSLVSLNRASIGIVARNPEQ
jgi:hypothetical protein